MDDDLLEEMVGADADLREVLAAALRERDEARAELKRYTDVYFDPSGPLDVVDVDALMAELERVKAELKRYTDVYGDPDVGPSLSDLCGFEEVDERPLTGLAAAAQAQIDTVLRGEGPIFCLRCSISTFEVELHKVGDAHWCGHCLAERTGEILAEHQQAWAERDRLEAAAVSASVPEPPPRAGGALVTPLVLAWIASQRVNIGQERVDQALRLVLERDAFGRGKYGQGLALEDGRDTVEDLRQELGDALQYGFKARVEGVEGERLEEARWLAHLLWLLLCADKVEVGL